jgi:hypothetical protein
MVMSRTGELSGPLHVLHVLHVLRGVCRCPPLGRREDRGVALISRSIALEVFDGDSRGIRRVIYIKALHCGRLRDCLGYPVREQLMTAVGAVVDDRHIT